MTDAAAPTAERDDVIVLDHVRKQFGTFVAVESADFWHRARRVLRHARTVRLR